MKFRVGDKVQLRRDLKSLKYGWGPNGKLDCLNCTATIIYIETHKIVIRLPFQDHFNVKDYEIQHVDIVPLELFEL